MNHIDSRNLRANWINTESPIFVMIGMQQETKTKHSRNLLLEDDELSLRQDTFFWFLE